MDEYDVSSGVTWTPIPGHMDYDLGSDLTVRSRKRNRARQSKRNAPRILRPNHFRSHVSYTLDGKSIWLDEIVQRTCPELRDDSPVQRLNRSLTPEQEEEIKSYEGFKPAHEVAEDFQLDSTMVRALWNEDSHE